MPSILTMICTNIDTGICFRVSPPRSMCSPAFHCTSFLLGASLLLTINITPAFVLLCFSLLCQFLFADYSKLLEDGLSIFVDKHDLTARSFYERLNEAQEEDDFARQIIQYLLGATEYRRFVDLLIDRRLFHYGPGSDEGSHSDGESGASSKRSGGDLRQKATSSSKFDDGDRDNENNNDAHFARKVSEEALELEGGSGSGSARK